MSEEKINKIEETLAHQEQQINDLSDMLIAQGREIDMLKKQVSKLEGKIENIEDGDTPPPIKNPRIIKTQ